MAEMISANVEKDIADIGKSINEKTVINPRYGNPFDSLPLAIQKVMEAGGFQPFLTETALLASVPTVSPKAAKALDTKKIWYWDGSWHDTGLSELDQAATRQNINLNAYDAGLDPDGSYFSSTLKIAGDIDAVGGTTKATANYTYVLNKDLSAKKMKVLVIYATGSIGQEIQAKVFTKGASQFDYVKTIGKFIVYRDGFNYFALPNDYSITFATNEYIGFSVTSNVLTYTLVSATSTPMYYNINSPTAISVPFTSEGKTARLQIGVFSEAKSGLVPIQINSVATDLLNTKELLGMGKQTVGKKTTPVSTASNASSAQWIPAEPVLNAGKLNGFSTYSTTAGTLDICVYTKNGTKEFIAKSVKTVSIVPGLNTFSNLNIAVSVGDYLGIRTSAAGITQYVASTDTAVAFPVYSGSLTETVNFAGPTGGYIWQFQFLIDYSGLASNKKWKGLKYVSFGDSITWYNGKTFSTSHLESGQVAKGYQSYVVDELGCDLDNRGQSGWDMTQIYASQIAAYDFTGVHLTTITSGANDCRKGVPVGTLQDIGSTFNTSTYAGAMQAAIEKVIASNKATKIVLITPIRGWYSEYNTTNVPNTDPTVVGLMKAEYPDMVKAIGKLYGIPVVDFYYGLGWNDLNKNYYLGDNPDVFTAYLLHPMNRGFQRMGELLVDALKKF
jgi:lysophospholipase L1-like esterase